MIKFTSYYGAAVWIDPAMVIAVNDGGRGSRGIITVVHFEGGSSQSLNEEHEYVARKVAEAKEARR